MSAKIFLAALFVAMLPLAAQNGDFVAATSTLTYRLSNPSQQIEGTTHSARGKGTCQSGQCDFQMTALLKLFQSGDSSRDLDMMQVTRGAIFPTLSVHFSLPSASFSASSFRCDVEIELSGQKMTYRDVAFQAAPGSLGTRITGTIPAKLSDFKIDAPSLLAIGVDVTWRAGQ
jgi:hypothetical protein